MARAPHPQGNVFPIWFGLLRRNLNTGVIYADLANVLIALRRDPDMCDALAFDEMLQDSILMKAIPLAPGSRPGERPPKRVSDDDVSRVQEWLQHNSMPRIGREIVGQAVEHRSRETRFHPIREALSALKWDGKSRLNTWLKDFMEAEGSDGYLAAIGSMFLISMVARVFRPGCKCDYMLVLEGEQGAQKSQACAVLAGDYFSDDLGDISTKDAKQHVRGKWLVEESELANFNRATTESLKSFLTRTHEKYRPPYAKAQVEEPRQCVLVGTTNKSDWNKDDTGARRFWPVRVGRIDIVGLKRVRDQIFAEAVSRYQKGEPWWPEPDFEAQVIKPEQETRRAVDPWEHPIFQWLVGHVSEKQTVMDVAQGALQMDKGRVGTADANRIKSAMSLAGWRKDPKRTERGFYWVYVPSCSAAPK
jgi:predicted P-loop ATPase